ncbi:D-amino acid dehydrogenase [Burkholderia sp. Ac-20379]|uniref:D-amino acid dehydrogenase n=1 Tax=Burkholderia sp. Ac-20379 TaxID=2703900 RepID=UPI0019803295|nr:D-amino acid dehydrogenase [Burkholderia sp. Ac-20379]MBN3725348.1 D-amino acid dehydrogenase [Burkholderia sp. Ac-20379]
MTRIAIIGAGITGVTTAYALARRGFDVTVVERNRYAAMETSFANGGQLSASNAEVWNSAATVLKGLKWMMTADAPLLLNPTPNWHKYSWMGEFLRHIPNYRGNTVETVRLAIMAREHLFSIAEQEGIDFDHETRGILHIYGDRKGFEAASAVNVLLRQGGLDRTAVTPQEIRQIEPAIRGEFYGGFFTPSDSTGDIHKFTRGLADACRRKGVTFRYDTEIAAIERKADGFHVQAQEAGQARRDDAFDAVVVCAGVHSRRFAAMFGDHVNIYPVKGYSITVNLDDERSREAAPWVSLLDDAAKIVTSRLGPDRFRVAGTAEINGFNKDIRADRVAPLVDWVRRYFPDCSTARVVPWAGLRPMMPNMLPKVGPGKRDGVFYNTGHGHLGWTLSCATAELLADGVEAAFVESVHGIAGA